MKQNFNYFKWKWLVCFMVLVSTSALGRNTVPCLIFTGNSDSKQCLNLSTYNRIYFSDDGFSVSSSQDETVNGKLFLYTLFNHLSIGDETPTTETGIESISSQKDSQLKFMPDAKSLTIESLSQSVFQVGIFSVNGVLLATSSMFANDILSLEALSPNVYFAVATDGNYKMTLKFIIR